MTLRIATAEAPAGLRRDLDDVTGALAAYVASVDENARRVTLWRPFHRNCRTAQE